MQKHVCSVPAWTNIFIGLFYKIKLKISSLIIPDQISTNVTTKHIQIKAKSIL